MSSLDLDSRLGHRVVDAAARALVDHRYVTPLEVLVGIRWIHPSHPDHWRQARVETIEELAQVGGDRLAEAALLLGVWARRQGLIASEVDYLSTSRDRHRLRFTRDGDPDVERALRTHWLSAALPAKKREELTERQSKPADLVVIMPLKDWTCRECGGTGDFLIMDGPGPLCLTCADLDHLVYLPAGDATLTRRARKASRLSAVAVRFSRARKRYERKGILVEEPALDAAETSCLADEEARARRRERAEALRPLQDERFQARFATAIREQFPRCPAERAGTIARRAGERGSGRVGRSRAGRAIEPDAVRLAVRAAVRHEDTDYDVRLMRGENREAARAEVAGQIEAVLEGWARPGLTVLRGGLA